MKKLQTLLSWTWTPFFALLTGALAVVLLTWALVPAEPVRLFGEPKKSSGSSSTLLKTSRTSALGATDRLGVSPRKTSAKSRKGSGTSRPRNPLADIQRADSSTASKKPRRTKRPARAKRSRRTRPAPPPPPKPAGNDEADEEEEEEEEQEDEAEAPAKEEAAEDDEDAPEPEGPEPEPKSSRRLVTPKLLKKLPFVQSNTKK